MGFGRTFVKYLHFVDFEWILAQVFLVKGSHVINFEWNFLALMSRYL